MNFHFAELWEQVADRCPNRTASICDGKAVTWREYEQRAAKIAGLLAEYGFGPDSKAGIYLHNSNEYLEAQFAVFKLGGCPINVNYRYKAEELVYLLDNADVEVVFFQGCYAMRIWEIKDRLPNVKLFVQINDGTEVLMDFAVDYERSMRGQAPAPRVTHNPQGTYMLYTGGTTGMPKGVMYPVGEFASFFLNMGAASNELQPPGDMTEFAAFLDNVPKPPTTVVACPMMHGTGVWLGCFLPHLLGGTVVSTAKLGLDPHRLLQLVEDHRATDLVIVGDAFARPLLEALDEAQTRGTPYDISSLKQIASSGVMWSAEVKQGLLRHHDMVLLDIFGSTEGSMGNSVTTRAGGVQTARFALGDGVRVISDAGEFVEPGSGVIGRLATSTIVPLGYYKDAEKSAATFREIDGVRYSFPGDYATVEIDGSITLLGRGSVCINTGGEKVFPEEVEEALKRHADVVDCLVVGMPDERFGQKVVAVVAAGLTDQQQLLDWGREQLAGYKAPRAVVFADQIKRAPNGKADYKWAASVAAKELQL
ncbi:MAG: AMP-binding protein [Pseudomonadota bacterium]